jgi:hypothetical protein
VYGGVEIGRRKVFPAEGVEVQLHNSFILVMDRGEWEVLLLGHFTPLGRISRYLSIGVLNK